MSITASDLVHREVHYCASTLVHTLYASQSETENWWCQALDLFTPIEDWESAAMDAGWTYQCSRMAGTPSFQHPDHGTHVGYDGWQDICEEYGIEPYHREIFEHWIVSDWLADKLKAKGEVVDKDFMGLTIWARTTTGQAIAIDSVLVEIAADLNAARGGVPLMDPEGKMNTAKGVLT